MSATVSASYVPPPIEDCEEETTPITLSVNERVTLRLRFWRGRTVDFAVMLEVVEDGSDEWCEVVRVDCCHSQVHRHQFRRSGQPETRTLIAEIPADPENAWTLIAREYDTAHRDLISRWDSFVRTWRES